MQKQQEEAERRASQALTLDDPTMSKRNSVSSLSPRQAQVLAQSLQRNNNNYVKPATRTDSLPEPQITKPESNSLPKSPAPKRPTTAKGQFLRTSSLDRQANAAIQEEMEVVEIDNFYSHLNSNHTANTNGTAVVGFLYR